MMSHIQAPSDTSCRKTNDTWFRVPSYQVLFVYVAYIAACSMNFISWKIEPAAALFRYVIAGAVLISFDWAKWDRFKIFLMFFLLVSLAARRLLVVWAIMAMVYQIAYLKIPLKNLAKIGVAILCIEFFFQIEILLFGLVDNDSVFAVKVSRYVYDLGTGNTNRIGALVLFFMLLLYIVMKDNRRTAYVVFSLTFGYIAYYITGCRTAFYGVIVINVVAIAYWFGCIRNWMKWFVAPVPILFFIGTFFLAANMDDNKAINEAASGRLYYIVKFTKEYTQKEWLVGAPIEDDAPLDSTYLDMITKGGILLASFFCVGFMTVVIRYFNKIMPYLPFVLALVATGLTETYFTGPNGVSIILWVFVLMPFVRHKPVL